MDTPSTETSAPPTRPFWIPQTDGLDHLPDDVQRLIIEFLEPLYEERVLRAATELERAQGHSYVMCTFWVMVQQMTLFHEYANIEFGAGLSKFQHTRLDQLWRTLALQNKIVASLLTATKYHERRGKAEPLEPSPRSPK